MGSKWIGADLYCCPVGIKMPRITEETIITSHKRKQYIGFSKRIVPIPNRKAGPALLQKGSIRAASCWDRFPEQRASAMLCAPTGYPPNNPIRYRYSVPLGMCIHRQRGRIKGIDTPLRELVSRIDRSKKGNRDGITVRKHSVTPSAAPANAVLVSKIKISIPTPAVNIDNNFPFICVTSKDSMFVWENSSMKVIYFLHKGVEPWDILFDFSTGLT